MSLESQVKSRGSNPAPDSPRSVYLRNRYNLGERIGVKLMVLTLDDLELLKQLRATGGLGRDVREFEYSRNPRSPREGKLLSRSPDRSKAGSNELVVPGRRQLMPCLTFGRLTENSQKDIAGEFNASVFAH